MMIGALAHVVGGTRRVARRCALAALASALGGVAVAQESALPDSVDRPLGAGRLIASWDFEERERSLEPIPRHWFRSLHNPEGGSHRPGFPKYNLAEFDDSVSVSGRWSMKLPTRGGSTSLVLAGGVVPSMPDGDVLVSVRVRTEGLVHARARVVGRFLDDKLQPVPGHRFASEPIITGGVWRPVTFEMIGDPAAAWVQLELQLLQPTPPELASTGASELTRRVYREDVSGAAWFDDLTLYQIPRVRLRSQSAFNVLTFPERPELELRVQDLTGESLRASMRVYSIDGREVDRFDEAIRTDGRAIRWTPRLDGYGWYRASARIESERGPVGSAVCDLAWLSPGSAGDAPGRRRFGVVLRDGPGEDLGLVPDIVHALGTGSLWLEVWERLERIEAGASLSGAWSDPWGEVGGVVEHLLEGGQDVTFVLDRAPHELASRARVDPDNPLGVMSSEGAPWLESLAPLVTRFGERVRRWQVGAVGSERAFFEPGVGESARAIHESLFRLIPRPIVVLAWGIAQSADELGSGGAALTMWTPYTIPHDSIPAYAALWSDDAEIALALELPPVETYGVRGRIRELAKRAVEAWTCSSVDAFAIESPWVWRDQRDGGPMPTSAFPAWRTLAEELSSRVHAGGLDLGEGLRVIIAEREDEALIDETSGMLIAWNESAPDGRGVIRAYLGHGAVRVRDIFGNERVVAPRNGAHEIVLGRTPVFIDGVDGRLLRFRGALRMEPGFIETRAERHEVEVVIENPWATGIEGVLRLAEPDGWTVTPRVLRFSIEPGEASRVPVSMTFGVNEAAGPRELVSEVALQAERRYPVLEMPIGAELGLEHIELSASYQYSVGAGRAGEARDLVVTIVVTNSGALEGSYELFAIAPGYSAREAPVTRLGPGESAVRRFVFEDGADALGGARVRVGLREIEGTGRLNRWVEVR